MSEKVIELYNRILTLQGKKNSFANGGQIDTTQSTVQSRPTKEEFIQAKRDSVRTAALNNSFNRDYASVPILEYDAQGRPVLGSSCLYTATDNYGKKYKVAGNLQFASNPQRYGFEKIALKDVQPGDLVQAISDLDWQPYHSMLFAGYDENGEPLFNYSNGSSELGDADAIRKNAHYYAGFLDPALIDIYSFIGTPEDNEKWANEYAVRYSRKDLNPVPVVPQINSPVIISSLPPKALIK